jgi:hypothetical protein
VAFRRRLDGQVTRLINLCRCDMPVPLSIRVQLTGENV